MSKCRDCIYRGEYRDMGASTPLCNRHLDFVSAIKAVEDNTPCKWYITASQVSKLQEDGTIPQQAPQQALRSIADCSKNALATAERMCKKIDELAKAMKQLVEEQ